MDGCEEHVGLFVEGGKGTQPVPVRRIRDGVFEVLFSPGFVEGVAAGDEIEVTDPSTGRFRVLRRGGNVSIKVFHETSIEPVLDWLTPQLPKIRGRVDGRIERATVITAPASVGFAALEGVMKAACAAFPGLTFWFGNVYDDDGRPLDWWKS